MKLIIATHNPAKALRYKRLLQAFPSIITSSLSDESITLKLDEPYSTSLENAVHKAKRYAVHTHEITLGIDESVTTNFLPPEEQPGVFVRRLSRDRTELSDEEVLNHWREVFKRYPPTHKRFIWDFSIALYDPRTDFLRTISVEQRSVVAETFSEKRTPGYPMSSFLMHEGCDRPYVEFTTEERSAMDRKVFAPFIEAFGVWVRENSIFTTSSIQL